MMDEDDTNDFIENEDDDDDTGKPGVASLTGNTRSRPDKSNESGSLAHDENSYSYLKRQTTVGPSEDDDNSNNDKKPSAMRTSYKSNFCSLVQEFFYFAGLNIIFVFR